MQKKMIAWIAAVACMVTMIVGAMPMMAFAASTDLGNSWKSDHGPAQNLTVEVDGTKHTVTFENDGTAEQAVAYNKGVLAQYETGKYGFTFTVDPSTTSTEITIAVSDDIGRYGSAIGKHGWWNGWFLTIDGIDDGDGTVSFYKDYNNENKMISTSAVAIKAGDDNFVYVEKAEGNWVHLYLNGVKMAEFELWGAADSGSWGRAPYDDGSNLEIAVGSFCDTTAKIAINTAPTVADVIAGGEALYEAYPNAAGASALKAEYEAAEANKDATDLAVKLETMHKVYIAKSTVIAGLALNAAIAEAKDYYEANTDVAGADEYLAVINDVESSINADSTLEDVFAATDALKAARTSFDYTIVYDPLLDEAIEDAEAFYEANSDKVGAEAYKATLDRAKAKADGFGIVLKYEYDKLALAKTNFQKKWTTVDTNGWTEHAAGAELNTDGVTITPLEPNGYTEITVSGLDKDNKTVTAAAMLEFLNPDYARRYSFSFSLDSESLSENTEYAYIQVTGTHLDFLGNFVPGIYNLGFSLEMTHLNTDEPRMYFFIPEGWMNKRNTFKAEGYTIEDENYNQYIPFEFDREYEITFVLASDNSTLQCYIDGVWMGAYVVWGGWSDLFLKTGEESGGARTYDDYLPTLLVGANDSATFTINQNMQDPYNTILEAVELCDMIFEEYEGSDAPNVAEGIVSNALLNTLKRLIARAEVIDPAITADCYTLRNDFYEGILNFIGVVVSGVDPTMLQSAVDTGKVVIAALASGTDTLADLIEDGEALLAEYAESGEADQDEITELALAIEAEIAKLKETNIIFNVEKLTNQEVTGLEIKSEGNKVTFTGSLADGKVYDDTMAKVYTVLDATDRLAVKLDVESFESGHLAQFLFSSTMGDTNMSQPVISLQLYDGMFFIDEVLDDTNFNTLAEFEADPENNEFAFYNVDGKLVILYNGEEVYNGEAELADVFNGEDDVYVGFVGGMLEAFEMEVSAEFSTDLEDLYEPEIPETGVTSVVGVAAVVLVAAAAFVFFFSKKRAHN